MQKILLLLLLLVSQSAVADYPLETIELKGRSVEEIVPMVRPFVEPDGAVSGMNNLLIIRTSPANLREIRELLKRFDQPPRRLLISVRWLGEGSSNHSDTRFGIDTQADKRARVTLGAPTRKGTVRMQGFQGDTERTSDHTSQVQTIEGQPAFIAAGVSVPVRTHQRYADGDIRLYEDVTTYRDVSSGFYARARLNGNRVTVDISPFRNELGNSPGSVNTANASTRVTGVLGEWLALGGVSHQVQRDRSGLGINATTDRLRLEHLEIKVEELN